MSSGAAASSVIARGVYRGRAPVYSRASEPKERTLPKVTIHDFRITDRVLAESDPDAGDVVFIGDTGTAAYPFVAMRKISGPGGVYIDALDIVDIDGASLGVWEQRFELDGESKPRDVVTEIRGVRFPQAGTYMVQYSVFDDLIASFPFSVVDDPSPAAGIVPGPLDASLSKSTICWIALNHLEESDPLQSGKSVKVPEYKRGAEHPVWYGYSDGRVYVLTGEGEQKVPGLTEAATAWVIARSKDKQSKVAEAECAVEVLPKDAGWDVVARDLLIGRRLNLRDGDAAVGRWKKDCEITILTPLPPPVAAPDQPEV
jgi:hypothetical protein